MKRILEVPDIVRMRHSVLRADCDSKTWVARRKKFISQTHKIPRLRAKFDGICSLRSEFLLTVGALFTALLP